MLTLERQDWTAITELVNRFREQINEAIESTQGHVDLIAQMIANPKPNATVETLGKRISGFTRLISTHMHRTGRLMGMFERLEHIRSGKLHEHIRERRRKLDLVGFFEDFVEGLDEIKLVDPETEAQEYRSRLTTIVDGGLVVPASPSHLTQILHDLLRNAIMYSLKATPIKIVAYAAPTNQSVQIDVVDEGYGPRKRVGASFRAIFATPAPDHQRVRLWVEPVSVARGRGHERAHVVQERRSRQHLQFMLPMGARSPLPPQKTSQRSSPDRAR
jgi:signal transduction histidine kinase